MKKLPMDSWALCVFVAVLSLGGSADEESICSRVREVRELNRLPIPVLDLLALSSKSDFDTWSRIEQEAGRLHLDDLTLLLATPRSDADRH